MVDQAIDGIIALRDTVIRMPTVDDAASTAYAFSANLRGCPHLSNVIGAADGSFVATLVMNDNKQAHYGYKHAFPTLLLLVVCDSNLRVQWMSIDCPGSAGDQAALTGSLLMAANRTTESRQINSAVHSSQSTSSLPPRTPPASASSHPVAASAAAEPACPEPSSAAAALARAVIAPGYCIVADGGVSDEAFMVTVGKRADQRYFTDHPELGVSVEASHYCDFVISSMRICVERCFGKIFGQWRLLRKQRYFPPKTRKLATCAVIIHNFVMNEELREGVASTDSAMDAATAEAAEQEVVDRLTAMLDLADVEACERSQIIGELRDNVIASSAPELLSTRARRGAPDLAGVGPRAELATIHAVDADAEFNPAAIARSSSAITRSWVESQARKGLPAVDDGLGVECPGLPGDAAAQTSKERIKLKRCRRRELALGLMRARSAFESKTGKKDAEYRVAKARLVTAGPGSRPQPKVRRPAARPRSVDHRPKRVARPPRVLSDESESDGGAGWDSEAESEGSAAPSRDDAASNPTAQPLRTRSARAASHGVAAALLAAADSGDDEE